MLVIEKVEGLQEELAILGCDHKWSIPQEGNDYDAFMEVLNRLTPENTQTAGYYTLINCGDVAVIEESGCRMILGSKKALKALID
jgi:hypothetical protein